MKKYFMEQLFLKICKLPNFFLLLLMAKENKAHLMISDTAAYRPWTRELHCLEVDPALVLPISIWSCMKSAFLLKLFKVSKNI